MPVTYEGGCRCGAVRYRLEGEPVHIALCHCADCRKSAGAPMVHWAAFRQETVTLLQGEPREYASSPGVTRSFCGICGTGLFYQNPDMVEGLIDVQAATLDDPTALPPQAHIQTAQRLDWMEKLDALPSFERYPD